MALDGIFSFQICFRQCAQSFLPRLFSDCYQTLLLHELLNKSCPSLHQYHVLVIVHALSDSAQDLDTTRSPALLCSPALFHQIPIFIWRDGPRWYFLFPNLLSSMCTIFPSPPIFWLLSNIVTPRTSQQKLSWSTPVSCASRSSHVIWLCSTSWHHKYVNLSISSNVMLLCANQLPLLIDVSVLCPLLLACSDYTLILSHLIGHCMSLVSFLVAVRTQLWPSDQAFCH